MEIFGIQGFAMWSVFPIVRNISLVLPPTHWLKHAWLEMGSPAHICSGIHRKEFDEIAGTAVILLLIPSPSLKSFIAAQKQDFMRTAYQPNFQVLERIYTILVLPALGWGSSLKSSAKPCRKEWKVCTFIPCVKAIPSIYKKPCWWLKRNSVICWVRSSGLTWVAVT